MPKVEIDYSTTIIYKITCNDNSITDKYVGHTTNFVQRKHSHKNNCVNEKSSSHKCKLYEIIRQHGGWSNWKMEIIHFFNCNNQQEAKQKEQEYFELLNANLNSIEPLTQKKISPVAKTSQTIPTPQTIPTDTIKQTTNLTYKFSCENCNIFTNNKKDYKNHLLTTKHKNTLSSNKKSIPTQNTCTNNDTKTTHVCEKCNKIYKSRVGLWYHNKKCEPINAKCFICDTCDFNSSKFANYSTHLSTRKHKLATETPKKNVFLCECGKEYMDRTGLWKHKKNCQEKKCDAQKIAEIKPGDDSMTDKDIIKLLIKENQEFKGLIMDLIKKYNTST